MLTTILANVFVACLILSLLILSIRVLVKQGKQGSCASCSTKKGSGCAGCQFANQCHS
ncbi:hypothetical protein [Sphaerochaeta sp.]|uniref:hypothetical protein n=1 Tax=Sphaerochaeta sp. TaxID=1972642 RepID=UPI002FCB1A60